MAKREGTRRAVAAKGLAPIPLPGDLATDLEAFCAAHYRAERAEVIRSALRFFIDARLAAEPEMRARFIAARARLTKDPAPVVPFRAPEAGDSEDPAGPESGT